MRIAWATICEAITRMEGRPVIVWPLIQGTYAETGQEVSFTVAVAIEGDYEDMGVGRHVIRHTVLDPEMATLIESEQGWTAILDPAAVPGMKVRELIKIKVLLEPVTFGVYTVTVSLDDGPSWTLSYAVAPWPELG